MGQADGKYGSCGALYETYTAGMSSFYSFKCRSATYRLLPSSVRLGNADVRAYCPPARLECVAPHDAHDLADCLLYRARELFQKSHSFNHLFGKVKPDKKN